MPILWAIIGGGLTFLFAGPQPIIVTNILLGLIVGLLFERRDTQ